MDKPTKEQILEYKEQCLDCYREVRAKWQEDEKYYERAFSEKLEIPVEYKAEARVLTTSRDMVDSFVDNIDLNNARIQVAKRGKSKAAEEDAEMLRQLYLGLIYSNNVKASISPFRTAGKHYALHGLTWFKPVWNADRWLGKPKQKKGESGEAYDQRMADWVSEHSDKPPIVIRAVHPYNVMPDPDTGGELYVIEYYEKHASVMNRLYPHWANPQKKDAKDIVEHVIYWDRKYKCELVDGEPLLKVPVDEHGYGCNPYTAIESGLGNMSIDQDPVKRYVGILRHLYDLLISESTNYSLVDVVLKRSALPWFTATGENAKLLTELSQRYGVVNPLPEGVELKEMMPQAPHQMLYDHVLRTNYMIGAHAAPPSVRGLSEEGVRSGADRRLVIAQGTSKYRYSGPAFSHGSAQMLEKCALIMQNKVPGNVTLTAFTPAGEFYAEIKKDKIKPPFACKVEFAPISDEDEYRRHDDLRTLVAVGLVTKEWAREQMNNVDAEAMKWQEMREFLRYNPMVLQVVGQYLAVKMNMALNTNINAETFQQEYAGQPQAGRRLVPPIPERAAPGSAEEMQNRMNALKSQVPLYPNQGAGGGGNR